MANNIVGDPSCADDSGRLVRRVQQLTPTRVDATSATFNGSVAIGIDTGFQDAIRPP